MQVRRGLQRVIKFPAGIRCSWTPQVEHLRRGDDEFSGNGPDITVRARLQTSADSAHLFLVLSIDAKETTRNWTTITGSSPMSPAFEIYSAPRGFTIRSVSPAATEQYRFVDTNTEVDVMEPDALYRGSAPWNQVKMMLIRSVAMERTSRLGLVQRWEVMGDAEDRDVGKTSVTATLQPVEVTLHPRK